MEMQNVLQQMTDMLSTNSAKDLFSTSLSTGTTSSKFHSVMSSELSKTRNSAGDVQSTKKDTANTVGVQTVNGKRQQELQTSVNQTGESHKTDFDGKGVFPKDDVQNIQEDVITPEDMETVAQWIGSLEQQICEELSITPEELEDVMETLGLQFFDLQEMGNVQQLVLAVSGEESVTALLTSEELSGQVENILQTVNEFTLEMTEQLDIPEDEFAKLLIQTEAAMETESSGPEQTEVVMNEPSLMESEGIVSTQELLEPVKENAQVTQKQTSVMQNVEDMPMTQKSQEGMLTQNSEETTVVPEDLDEKQTVTQGAALETEEQNPEKTEPLDVVTKQPETSETEKETETINPVKEDNMDVDTKQVNITKSGVSSQGESDGEMEHSSEESGSFKDKGQQSDSTPLMEQVMNQVSGAKTQFSENVQDKVQATQQMQEIFEQVVEQVKVNVTADTSEMVMQLNPENLGKVNLSVVAKEGHITAQFVTENEVARQALESQIQQLRETLGEQGLKVDKVEVSVSDFNFQNGNQANAEEQKEQQRELHAKQVQRNINLADLDDLADMTEAEELAVKIMQSNGNQIDYTA